MKRNKHKRKLSQTIKLTLCIIVAFGSSCEKLVQVDAPNNAINKSVVYTTDQTATSTVLGMYSILMQGSSIANYSNTIYGGLSADEFQIINNHLSSEYAELWSNNISATNSAVSGLWGSAFKLIYHANIILEGLASSSSLTTTVKIRLEGEAKFIRAFCYFYLINYWGEVPILTSSDYRINRMATRNSQEDVFGQVVSDLTDAVDLLTEGYIGTERVRPNKWTAAALLSRVYLYMGDWEKAESHATSIINASNYSLVNLDQVFLSTSNEAIWQLKPLTNGSNTFEGGQFNPGMIGYSRGVLTSNISNAFESGDQRKIEWVGTYTDAFGTWSYPFKYKTGTASVTTEYNLVFRLAEQYLIRAEARAQRNNIDGAIEDVNRIRQRAGLEGTTSDDKNSLLRAIEQERTIEFFAEWGHRWFDLKRANRADEVLSPIKSDWQATDKWYPIPQNELLNNPNLTQNAGY